MLSIIEEKHNIRIKAEIKNREGFLQNEGVVSNGKQETY